MHKSLLVLFYSLVINIANAQVESSIPDQFTMKIDLENLNADTACYLVISFLKTGSVDHFIWNDSHCFSFITSISSLGIQDTNLAPNERLVRYQQVLPLSQLIIENDFGDMETIGFNRKHPRTKLLDDRVVVNSQFALPKPINNFLSFEHSSTIVFKYKTELSELLLRSEDTQIRLHYLYVPYEHNDSSPFILTSNWVDIYK